MSAQNADNEIKYFCKSGLSVELTKKLFMDEETADVYFVFETDTDQRRIAAHKIILAKGSSVFQQMFYGVLKESGDVKIVDSSVEGFQEFLQFFYLENVGLTMVNIDNVMNLATKYNVNECLDVCDDFLVQHLKLEDICDGLQLAITFKREYLKYILMRKMNSEPDRVFASGGFLNCSRDVLEFILIRPILICEKQVFEACMAWANNCCEKSNLDASKMENRREKLGDCMHLIQFGLMNHAEISQCIAEHRGLFDREELEDILTVHQDTIHQLRKLKVISRIPSAYSFHGYIFLRCSVSNGVATEKRFLTQAESTFFTISEPLLLGKIGKVPIRKISTSTVQYLTADLTIFDRSHTGKSEPLLKNTVNLKLSRTSDKEQHIRLSHAVFLEASKLYEIKIFFESNWESSCYYTFANFKEESQLNEDIKITLLKNNFLDRLGGIISFFDFNLVKTEKKQK